MEELFEDESVQDDAREGRPDIGKAVKMKDILQNLKWDLKQSEIKKKYLDEKIATWRREYNGEPYGNERKGRSQIVSRDIKKQSEWQHAAIMDPFVSSNDIIKCSPVTWEDRNAAEQNELVLNTQFCRQFDRYNFMAKALKVLDQEGTLVVQVGWEYEDAEEEVEVPVYSVDFNTGQQVIIGTRKEKQTVIKKNQPTAKVCRNEDIFIDPTCMDNMDECQFVIYRYETNISTLRADGRYKNLEKINLSSAEAVNNGEQYYPEDRTYFRFKDDPRKKIVVYEYWGNYDVNGDGIAEPIVCAWVNDTIIRLTSNPYPDGKPPFLVVPFSSVPFQMQGESHAELLSDTQKVKTAILRGIIDNMAQSTNGQKGVKKGALDVVNRKKFLNGENFEFNNSPNDFWDGSYNEIPSSAFNMYTLMSGEAESMTGVKSFGGGITGNALGSTATGARGALDATAARRLNIVRNVAENLIKPMMRKWMSMNAEFLDDNQIIRITNDEFVEVKRDDLEGLIDIDIHVSTNEDNAAKAQEIGFLLQTIGPNEDPGIRKILMSQVLRLHRMPDAAKMIEEYQPQPDPMAQQIQMLELQKLQAEIAERQSRAQENQVDMRVKSAKADLDEAKARATHSQADLQDLDFLEKESGVAQEKEMAKKEHDRLAKLDLEAMKGMNKRQDQKSQPKGLAR